VYDISPTRERISPEYLAGFVDGEGTLGIERINNGKVRPYGITSNGAPRSWYHSPEHIVRVQVSNTNLAGLKSIQAVYGGSLTTMKSYNRPNSRVAYKLTWNSRRAEQLLKVVGPYLVLKRPQYLLLLEYMSARHLNRRLPGFHGRLDPTEIELRDSFQRQLKELNHRGRRETEYDGPTALQP
jgi:hypothetical protein